MNALQKINQFIANYEPKEPPQRAIITPEALHVFVADLMKLPMRYVALKNAVGRFALVEYLPRGAPDPEIMVCLKGRMAKSFNQMSLEFQRTRACRMPDRNWYQHNRKAAENLLQTLIQMEPSEDELHFVGRWVLLVVARGERIDPDAEPERLLGWSSRFDDLSYYSGREAF